MDLIISIIDKITDSEEILLNYNKFMDSISYLIQTNIPDDTIRKYVKDEFDKDIDWSIAKTAIGGKKSHDYTYSLPDLYLYVTKL